jgi:hypothetical protein
MSPMSRPSKVDALKRGVGTAASKSKVGEHDVPLPAAAEVPQRPRPEKPVRFTLDLDREHHRFLKTYTTEIEARGAAEVMRALLDELRDDTELAARVRARVWQAHA